MTPEGMSGRERFLGEDVEGRVGDLAGIECREQISLHHMAASGAVDEERADFLAGVVMMVEQLLALGICVALLLRPYLQERRSRLRGPALPHGSR